ncbi:phage protease [Rhodococcus sp. BS-15]|uniref:phage protease n=1 Tax=Rhodococcus sp. BS-15 TaxID=1304954 RepID=UPI000A3EA99B|nr:phage protease [Rhodococcus sp. BS-15]
MEFSPEQLTRLMEALGLKPDETDAEVVVLAVEDLATAPVDAAAVAAKTGGLVIDPTVYETLKAEAERGRTVAAAAATREREQAVNAAITKGAIPPARKAHWMTVLEADPTMAKVLASMPNVIPLEELGHSDPGVNDPDGQPLPSNVSW